MKLFKILTVFFVIICNNFCKSQSKYYIQDYNHNSYFKIDYNPILDSYISKHIKYKKSVGKSFAFYKFYKPYFESVFYKTGVPIEITVLCIVESNMEVRATSHVGAKGFWQFMPNTAREVGLVMNDKIDERFDPYKSTETSARYLKQMHKQFGDWNLAIAAYNCGAGNVRKAMKKSGSKNFWTLRPFLPKETQSYVPKVMAMAYIFKYKSYHKIPNFSIGKDYQNVYIKRYNEPVVFSRVLNSDFERWLNPHLLTDLVPKGVNVYGYNGR